MANARTYEVGVISVT